MNDVRKDPLGVDGFEFVEYAAPDAQMLHSLFENMGFSAIARHREMNITLYRQGDINFLVNEEVDSFAANFAREHGPCCTGFALRVANAQAAYEFTIANGGLDANWLSARGIPTVSLYSCRRIIRRSGRNRALPPCYPTFD